MMYWLKLVFFFLLCASTLRLHLHATKSWH